MAFEAFVQVEDSLARRYEGSGIGLPLTKRLVELHGGTIAVDSGKGQRTTVVLRFPGDRVVARDRVLRSSAQFAAS